MTDNSTEERREKHRWTETQLTRIKGEPKVFVCFGAHFGLITSFFAELGFIKAKSPADADLIVYAGGADVSPELYNQKPIERCGSPDTARDTAEKGIFELAQRLNIPQLGICRGAQFLHVMNGGELWQHVNGHAGKPHEMYDMLSDKYVMTSSTHHQMMQWNDRMNLVACCAEDIATIFWDASQTIDIDDGDDPQIEVEVASYPDNKSLCIQGHPEYGPIEFASWASKLIFDWFMLVGDNKFSKVNNTETEGVI